MPSNNTNVSVIAYSLFVGGVSSSNRSIPTSSNYQNKTIFNTAQHKENTTFSYTVKSKIQHYHNGTHLPARQHLPAHSGAKAQLKSKENTTIVKVASTPAIHKNFTPKVTIKDPEIPVRAKLISASYNISKHDPDSKVNISNVNPLHYKLKPSIKYKNISEAQSNNTIVNSHQPLNAIKHQKTKGQKLNKDSELRLYLKHEYDHDNNNSKLFNTTYVEPIRVKKNIDRLYQNQFNDFKKPSAAKGYLDNTNQLEIISLTNSANVTNVANNYNRYNIVPDLNIPCINEENFIGYCKNFASHNDERNMAVYYREAQKIFSEKIAPSISSTFTQVCTIHIVPLDHISNRLGFYSPAHINRDINSFNCSLKIANIVSGPLTPMHEFGHAIHLQFIGNTIPSNIFREGIAEFVAIYEQPKKIADYCQQAQEFFRHYPNLYSKFNEILDLSYRYNQHLNGEPIYIIGALLTYYFVIIKPVMKDYLICVRDNKVEANYLQCDTQFQECNNHIRRLGELKCQNVYSECVRGNKISSIHSNAQVCNTWYQQCWEGYNNRHCVNEDIKCKSNIPISVEQVRAKRNKECEQHLTAAYSKDEFKDFINNKCQNPSSAAFFAEPLQIIANCVAQKCKLFKAHFTNSIDAEKQLYLPVIIVEDNIITNKRGCLGPLWKSLLIEKLERGESIMIDHFTPCPEVTYMPIDEKLIYAVVSNKTVTISFVAQPRPMKSNASIILSENVHRTVSN